MPVNVRQSWGKAPFSVIVIFCAVALLIASLHRSSGRVYSADPTPMLFVTDNCSQAVTAYPAAINGDISPLAPAPTSLSQPQFVTVDKNGNIYATNSCTRSVSIYAEGSTGNAAPTAIIGGSNTGLTSPQGIAVDGDGNIYVADSGSSSVFVYPPLGSSTGLLNESPTATISGSNTGLDYPLGLALDPSANIYVTDLIAVSVFVYPAIGSSTGLLNESPTATINGSDTDLKEPQGIALDSSRNIYVADSKALSVFIYPALGSSKGTLDEAPTATISGGSTGLASPVGMALDSNNKIYVVNSSAASVSIYPALGSSKGTLDEAPTATINGSDTGLGDPLGIALDSNNDIYVADSETSTVTVYQPLGSSTGVLNKAPSAAISAPTTTGLIYPQGVALDSSGNLYVAGETYAADYALDKSYPPGVFVYSAGSNGNTASIASISGSNTGLMYPVGIALDSSARLYVADSTAVSVFIYPALGSSEGTLDEAPTATINGSSTGLNAPFGIALDSDGNIYVADSGAASVSIYPALGSSKGTLDEAPTATISGGSTNLIHPQGIALDSSGNIYVADCHDCEGSGADVYVYPPLGSSKGTLDEPPTATISGGNTLLQYPVGIALDSSASIYVADQYASSVFVYPPLGTSKGTLNEAPSSDLSGPLTELGSPLFITVRLTATPTPTATPTASTPIATATSTATATPTVTATLTPTPTASVAPTPVPASLKLSSKNLKGKTLTFPSEPFGTTGLTSGDMTVTVTNPAGKKGVAVQMENLHVDPPANYSTDMAKTTCAPGALAPGSKCAIALTFTPTAFGPNPGTLTLTDNAHNNPQTLTLEGRGIHGVLTIAPKKSLPFGKQPTLITSAPKQVTLTNNSRVPFSIGAITSTDPAEFVPEGSCANKSLANGSSCTFNVTFTPASKGAKHGTLEINDDASGSPQKISMSGQGT